MSALTQKEAGIIAEPQEIASSAIQARDAAPSVDWLSLSREAFSASRTWFDTSVRADLERDYKQFYGEHPPGSKYHSDQYRFRSRLFRPKTRAAIRKGEATAAEAFFATADVISIKPLDATNEMADDSARLMQALLQYRLTNPTFGVRWFQVLCAAYQEAQAVGVVASYQFWRYDEERGIDKPEVALIPPENLLFDPAADWLDPVSSSPYVIRMVPMFVKDVEHRARKGQFINVDQGTISRAVQRQSDTLRLVRQGNRSDPKAQSTSITAFTTVWVHEVVVEWEGADYVYYTLADEELISPVRPIRSVWWHGRRPFVLGCSVIEAHRQYPSGIARLTRDTQAEINEVANQRIDNVKFVLNKRYFVRRNKQVDLASLRRNAPGSSTLMDDPDKDVRIVDTQDVTASGYQEQDRLNLDFDDVAGTFSQASVQSNRNLNETVGGMNILTSNASQISSYALRTFTETWVQPVLYQLMQLEQRYETDETVIALAARQANVAAKYGMGPELDDLLENELVLRVNVGMGATSPQGKIANLMLGINSLRVALADGLLQQYGLDVQELIKEVFGIIGYSDGNRFFDQTGEDPRVLALEQQVQKLNEALRSKFPPEMIAAQVAKLYEEVKNIRSQRVKLGVDTVFSATQAAEVIATVPAVAPVADQVMRSAGWRPEPGGAPTALAQPAAPIPPMESLTDRSLAAEVRRGFIVPSQQNTHPGFPANPNAAPAAAPAAPAKPATPAREPGPMKGATTMRMNDE